jgi:1-aminocyclopropane-1-carboxylate deaminase
MPATNLYAPVEVLQDALFTQKKVSVAVLRLDTIHPVISGNKLFKLHFFLQKAQQSSHKTIVTFGGAWSNHLVATAYACKLLGLQCIGIVRGEAPATPSASLQQCTDFGMQLKYISRQAYAQKDEATFIESIKTNWGDCIIIPEGGYGSAGANGAAFIWQLIPPNTYTDICLAVGTCTTLAGIVMSKNNENIIGVPVLKSMNDIEKRMSYCGVTFKKESGQILDQYHFGGYAKTNPILIDFMNYLWLQHRLPTDFVYSAKLFYAVYDTIKNNHFAPGSSLLCIHTGGLQGNQSLPVNALLF